MKTPIAPPERQAPVALLLDGYRPAPASFDEYFFEAQLRPHCVRAVHDLNQLGVDELTRRWQQAERLVRENGLVYNAYGDADNAARPWELDALPLLISPQEWQSLAPALVQRARVMNLVLADLYGPQHLLTRGLLPPELVFGHPGFQRSFHSQLPPDEQYLYLYAVDLARGTDGRWWVVGDRTDAPIGMGYTLENRIVISRALPNVIHDCQAERLAGFFVDLRETLRNAALTHRENPRIVLLSHGPSGPGYFEDAYLARYLGYTLAEGGDLAVRGDQVTLKTLGGLLPVDVIVRRLSDQFCDPLELGGDAALGVPGLLQAARGGQVVIVNAPGSSLLESAAFMPFLPTLARELIGEELLLPSVATWWCGQPDEQRYVLEHIDNLVVSSAFRLGRREQFATDQLQTRTNEDLLNDIQARPQAYVAREALPRSTAPVWRNQSIQSSYVALRVFLAASNGSYRILPGGLVRVATQSADLDRSILAGEGSKDAWVLSEGPVPKISLLHTPGQAVQLRRSGVELPSRVADNLFWLGRHIERTEGAARLLRPIVSRLTSEARPELMPELTVLLRAAAVQGQIEPGFAVAEFRSRMLAIEQALPSSVLDAQQPGSLRSTVAAMYRNASLVRDRMSIDSWRIIRRLEQRTQAVARRTPDLSDILEMVNAMILDLAAYGGLVGESMTRTQAWRFLDLGRRLERSLHTVSLIQSTLIEGHDQEAAVFEAVLEVADSMMTYRSRYLANLQLVMVLDLLLTDETNPRSLAFQLIQLADHVENLPRDRDQPLRGPEQRIALSVVNSIRLLDLESFTEPGSEQDRAKLDRALGRIAEQLPKLSDLISHRYLIHADVPRQLADPG